MTRLSFSRYDLLLKKDRILGNFRDAHRLIGAAEDETDGKRRIPCEIQPVAIRFAATRKRLSRARSSSYTSLPLLWHGFQAVTHERIPSSSGQGIQHILMASTIFRSSAVERLSTPDRLDQPLRITTPFGWIALCALGGLVAIGVVASVIISVPVTVRGSGIIITTAGILDVPIGSAGRLTEILVRPGQQIGKGAVVARLDQPDVKLQLEQATAEQRELANEHDRVAGFQAQSGQMQRAADDQRRKDLAQRVILARQQLQFLHERLDVNTELFNKHLTPRQKLVDTKIEIGKAEEEIADDERRAREIALDAEARQTGATKEMLDLELKLSAAGRRVDALAARLAGTETVTSPYAGTVVELKRNAGDLAPQGASLLSLLPDEQPTTGQSAGLIAMMFVAGSEGKKIAPGMVAEISPSTFPREEYGLLLGHVRSVAAIPATEDGMMRTLQNHQLVQALSAGGAPFQVEVALDPDGATATGYRWSSSTGPAARLSPGTLADGAVWVRKIRLIEFAIPALRRAFADE